MTEKRCRRCGVPHADHPDANQSGGHDDLVPWEGDLCPICVDKRRELAKRAVWRYLAELLDPTDDYVSETEPEQTTLPGVTADA